MKVVLFCGGLGTRLRDYDERIPKPMVRIGYRPILWHIMKYYAHFGHTDFILCLGYKADVIKSYFLNYDECLSNDFVLSDGGRTLHLLNSDIDEWNITFVDTGLHANIGERFMRVRPYLDGEKVFLANYADGLTDLYLPDMIDRFTAGDRVAGFLSVRPMQSFHVVVSDPSGAVQRIEHVGESDMHINGGYFVFRDTIFDYINDGEELVHEPFQRLIAAHRLMAYQYDGFWACMDTFKEKQLLEDLHDQGEAHWALWEDRQTVAAPITKLRRTAVAQ